MSVTGARLEASTHARAELVVTFVGVQRGVTLNDVEVLVLFGVRMAQSRYRMWGQPREVNAEVFKTKNIAELAFCSAQHSCGERCRIRRRLASWRYFGGDNCKWLHFFGHGASR